MAWQEGYLPKGWQEGTLPADSIPSNDPSTYPQGKSASNAESMRKEFMRKEMARGTDTDTSPASIHPVQKAAIALGSGMWRAGKGVEQLGRTIIGDKEGARRVGEDVKAAEEEIRPLKESYGKVGITNPYSITEFVGEALPYVTMPGGTAGSLLKRAGTAALSGSAMGAAMPVTGQSPNIERLGNIAAGAVGGGIATGATAALGKTYNAIKSAVQPSKIAQLGEKYGVSTTLGEDLARPSLKKAEEKIVPDSFRETQLEQSRDAAEGLLNKYVAPDGDNPAFIDKAYDKVRSLAETSGAKVEVPNTITAATNLKENYPQVFEALQDTRVKSVLNSVIGGTKDTNIPAGLILDPVTNLPITPATTKPQTFNAAELIELRKNLGKEIRRTTDKESKSDLLSLRTGIDADLATIDNGAVSKALKEANDSFVKYDVKYNMIQNAYDQSMRLTKSGETGVFSPIVFQGELKKLIKAETAQTAGKAKVPTFTPNEIQEFSGMGSLLHAVQESGNYRNQPKTGYAWGKPGLALSAVGSLGAQVGAGHWGMAVSELGLAVASKVLFDFLTMNPSGKIIAKKAAQIPSSSPQITPLLDSAFAQIGRLSAKSATTAQEQRQ